MLILLAKKSSANRTSIRLFLISMLIAMIAACAGPPALHQAVIGYDETTAQLEQQLLLLNIARLDMGMPIHFTTTSSIAATFDWSTTIGIQGNSGDAPSLLDLGASASENPTFSIIPLTGMEFTKQVLTPLSEEIFNFLIFQGESLDQSMRLMAEGIEFQRADGSLVRFINNDPSLPSDYEEYRQVTAHLSHMSSKQQLFVRKLVYREVLFSDYTESPDADGVNNAFDKGLRWHQKPDGSYQLSRLASGRILVSNYDPATLDDQELHELNQHIQRHNPNNFVYLDIRADHPGGEMPMLGAIKLRSLHQMIFFISKGIHEAPEFDVDPDPRSGQIEMGPRSTMQIVISDSAPESNVPYINYADKYFSVADTRWDRNSFMLLSYLFQTAVGGGQGVGIPITISK